MGIDITEVIQVYWQLTHENIDWEAAGLTDVLDTYSLNKGLLIVMEKSPSLSIADKRIEVVTAGEWLLEVHQ